ncbi:tyrosine-protein kinase Etk/Wzc [Halomonas korlensis]|uniref:Tyrosine-protein kinase Etk/Wzc n=1 Tax=Halomonas korlensis TaxID=463301 RepID=A0A1I7F8J8_9GAMM|nr:tyrosine-protein kinase Etk/Wzc [Halomonas korlensis]
MTEKPPSQQSAVPDIDLGHFFGWLVDHKWLIALVMLLFAIGGYLYAGSQPLVYSADSLVQVESESSSLINLPGMAGQQSSAEQSRTLTEIGILKSRMVLGGAVDRENLTIHVSPRRLPYLGNFLVNQGVSVPSFLRDYPYVWANEFAEVSRFEVPEGASLGPYILRSEGDGGYSLLQDERVVVTGQAGETVHSDEGHRLFVQRIEAHPGAEFVLNRSTRLSAINGLKSSLSSQQAEGEWLVNLRLTGQDQTQIENTLNTIMQVFLAQNIERQSAEADRQLEFLEEQIPQVGEQLAASETNLNNYRAQRDSVDLDFQTEAMLNKLVTLENQLSDIEFQRTELERRFTSSHPTYQALMEKKEQLEENKAELESRITDLPETQQEILRLERAARVNQEIYVQLLNKQQEMRLIQAGTVGNVRILDSAVVQPSPIAPRSSQIMAISLLMGLLVAIAIVMVRYLLNRGIEVPKQLQDLGLPVYATVPLSEEQAKLSGGFKSGPRRRKLAGLRDLLALRSPTDLSIEALRSLRTSLHFAMLDAGDNRLMITSSAPTVGKSFISANLAAICAQAGQKVLVIDGDMRKGHLHHAFKGDSKGGLSELLSGQQTLEEAIRGSAVEGLDYIARGTSPPNPSELLMRPNFSRLLAEVSSRYDLVIIDTPPVLAVTDAAIIGKQVGTGLLVARFGVNPPREVEAAMQRLETSGVTLKGAILNATERTAATSYGYYGHYNYSYK